MPTRPIRVPVLLAALTVAGCQQGQALPAALTPRRSPPIEQLIGQAKDQRAGVGRSIFTMLKRNRGKELHFLALSGGGQNGAFGAGVLNGWRRSNRPEFQLVTGVSTGALLSTFAFLDSADADQVMKDVYNNVKRTDVLQPRDALEIPVSSSYAKTDGLKALIARYATNEVIDAVADRSDGGLRLLLVGTTNLDLGTFAVWDLTDLARRKQYDLYRDVLLASASIPVFFPPVVLDGALHADGGVRQQMFTPYAFLDEAQIAQLDADGGRSKATLWVIVNAALGSEPKAIQPRILDIAERTVPVLLDAALLAGLWRLWGQAQLESTGFRMLHIPDANLPDAADGTAFDQQQMRNLYAAGEQAGLRAGSWLTVPPAGAGSVR